MDFLKTNGIDTSGVLATNLERLLTTPQVRQALGFDFSNKQLTLLEPEADVLQKLKKVVERMKAKGFHVGEIYKVDQRLEWIQDVLGLQPAPATPPADPTPLPSAASNGNSAAPPPQAAPSSAPSSSTATPQSTAASAGTSTLAQPQPAPTPAPPAPSVYYTLINPTKLLPATIPTKIVKTYKELQTVYISGQRAAPHAVGALLRILVEITAQEYLMQKHGFRYDTGGRHHFRDPTDLSKTYDELREKLNYIANDCGLPRNTAQVLRTLLSRQLMTAELNQVMHNTIFTADAAAIKGIWQNYENVFDYLIDEIK